MKKYCTDCKFAGDASGEQVYCNKNQTWMNKWATCTDFQWQRASRSLGSPLALLTAASCLPELLELCSKLRG